jgi:hypothetical protein
VFSDWLRLIPACYGELCPIRAPVESAAMQHIDAAQHCRTLPYLDQAEPLRGAGPPTLRERESQPRGQFTLCARGTIEAEGRSGLCQCRCPAPYHPRRVSDYADRARATKV